MGAGSAQKYIDMPMFLATAFIVMMPCCWLKERTSHRDIMHPCRSGSGGWQGQGSSSGAL